MILHRFNVILVISGPESRKQIISEIIVVRLGTRTPDPCKSEDFYALPDSPYAMKSINLFSSKRKDTKYNLRVNMMNSQLLLYVILTKI